jgi:hypothetical protein
MAPFCWGLHIVKAEKGKATEISYSDARLLDTFTGVLYCDNAFLCKLVNIENKFI